MTPLQNRKTHRIWPTIFSQGSHFNKKKHFRNKKKSGPQGRPWPLCPPPSPWLRLCRILRIISRKRPNLIYIGSPRPLPEIGIDEARPRSPGFSSPVHGSISRGNPSVFYRKQITYLESAPYFKFRLNIARKPATVTAQAQHNRRRRRRERNCRPARLF